MTEYGIIIEKYLKYISKSDNKVEIKSVKKGYFFIFKCIIIPFKFNYVFKK